MVAYQEQILLLALDLLCGDVPAYSFSVGLWHIYRLRPYIVSNFVLTQSIIMSNPTEGDNAHRFCHRISEFS